MNSINSPQSKEDFLSKKEKQKILALYAVFFIVFILSKVFPYGYSTSGFIQGPYYIFNEYNIIFPFFEVVEISFFILTIIELDKLKIHHGIKFGMINCVVITFDILIFIYIGPIIVFRSIDYLSIGFYIGIIALVLLFGFNIILLKFRKRSIMFSQETKERKKLWLKKKMKDLELKEKMADKRILSTYSKMAGFQERGIVVFVSYASKDADFFKIKELAEELSKNQDVDDVLYWQENMKDNIIKYMNENLGKCDIFILFCSPNALESEPVEKEWTAAEILGKPIIPVFLKPDHIPPLLKSKKGIQYDAFDRKKNLQNLQDIINKQISKGSEAK